ncbi:MAG: type II toxin-antitoxin system RelB/DinJ family antitoxin [Oscillospiraceae bacterium]|nr:type II toxin-antitoxin system RelB/DinJ family antitoxin [Oscillospiraceae bacterium]
MSTKTITVRIDEDTKREAEVILGEIGLNMTSLFNACLKAVVREKRVPFALVGNEFAQKQMIRAMLTQSEAAAADPSSKRYTHEEIFLPLRKRYGYELQD